MPDPRRTNPPDRRHPGSWSGKAPFLVRWALAITAGMLLAGVVEYSIATRQLADRALQENARNYQAQVEVLQDVLAQDLAPQRREGAVEDELRRIGRGYGTLYAGLFDRSGQPFGSRATEATDPQDVDPDNLAAVVASGELSVQSEADEGEMGEVGRYEFLLPVTAPEGLLVLEIDQRADVVTDLVADLRSRKALGLLVAVLFAVPLSYLLGGRGLHRQQVLSKRAADTDPLTGLAGRRPFRPVLETALASRTAAPVALALIDLDGFKQVNDRLGHSYGDRVLTALADAFDRLRIGDRAFRLGGDEFAVVLPGTDDDQASEVLQRVREELAAHIPGVTFSCGVACSPAGAALALQELWERADAALYEAKRRGRRQTATFATMSTRHAVSAEKLDAATALLAADSAITVAFQPIWDLRRGVVLAHEALLRLPVGTAIDGPQEAFELAQRLGIAAALDARARRAVLQAVRGRGWQGLLFLNVHPDALADLDVDALVQELARPGWRPPTSSWRSPSRPGWTTPSRSGCSSTHTSGASGSPWTTWAAATPACGR